MTGTWPAREQGEHIPEMEGKDVTSPPDVVPLEELRQQRRSSSVQSNIVRHDQVAPEAKGEDLPEGYYWSSGFIGTLVATCLANISGTSV